MAPGLVTPEKAARGKLPTDVWWHTIVPTAGSEKTGYPTQKPEGVLRRIVQASTRPGDWCLDFFAGTGTLGAVAARARPPLRADRLQPRGRPRDARSSRRDRSRAPRGGRRRACLDSALMPTYHVEMRHFPRVQTRFNQTGEEVGAIVLLWVQDQIVEVDDEKWAPWESSITIIEGPSIPIGGLSLGRGWNTAQRQGTDVTVRVLDEARNALADGSAYTPPWSVPPRAGLAGAADRSAQDYPSKTGGPLEPEPPPAEIAALLGAEPGRLLAAWRAVSDRTGGLAPSESLALAERELQREHRPTD